MFLKAFKQKNKTTLKGSEIKRLRQRIEAAFTNLTADQLSQLLPSTKTVTQIKVITHSTFQTNIFCVNKLPILFEIENDVLVPTLYMMWQIPELLPHFTTHDSVLHRLTNGADLMLPGVVPQGCGINMYGHYKKDQLVGVNLVSNKATVAVGILLRSSEDLYMCGGQGQAVKILHIFGDKLWSLEPSLTQQVPNINPEPLTTEDFPELGSTGRKPKSKVANEDHESHETDNVNELQKPMEHIKADDTGLETSFVEDNSQDQTLLQQNEESENLEVTTDVLLKNAFLAALKNNGKSLQLPMLTSTFYRQYMLPEISENIDIKKTRYKKLSNFLNEMIEQNFIVAREESKGVDKIISIDHEHPELVNFITDYKEPGPVDGTNQPLFHSELTETYVVTDATAAFFTKHNFKRGEGIPTSQIHKIVREHVSKMNLKTDPVNKIVTLDDCLRTICDSDEASISEICRSLITKMDHTFQMCKPQDSGSNKPLIEMWLSTRSGNKKVTLVSNISCYGIVISEFIKLCKQGAAASTTIVKIPNQKREVLQIQGNQVRFIFKLLTETYKLSPKNIIQPNLGKEGKQKKKKKK